MVANTAKNSQSLRQRLKNSIKHTCSVKTVKKRMPILEWLPHYNFEFFIQDLIAGIAVGLTAIPQGIAYAVIAGLAPEYGLYASLTSGFVYVIFGSCRNVTVGPTAILAAMIAKYVANYTPDFAILAAFLSGIIQLMLGILHLGFLVEFISQPVITGFTTAAALQIASAQLKSLFGLAGSAGNNFAESVVSAVQNIKTATLWDPILGFATIIMLLLLQRFGKGCKRTGGILRQLRWFISLARNAVVVFVGMIIAYTLQITLHIEPLAIIGEIGSGLPKIQPPPFTTVVGNETYGFVDMLQVLGPQSVTLVFVGILESVTIAKAFSGGIPVDATQEMIALGLCNVIGSFAGSMPITGSFTRTAVNHASGVQTPAGGISKCLLLIFALSVMTSTFYYIPKASLAGLILVAMFSMIDYAIFVKLWKSTKKDLFLLTITLVLCLYFGLEYGILSGIIVEALILLFNVSRPKIGVNIVKTDVGELIVVPLDNDVAYCAAEHVRRTIIRASHQVNSDTVIVIDGTNLQTMDSTVASNLMLVLKELDIRLIKIMFLNFNNNAKRMCVVIDPKSINKFVVAPNAMELIEMLQNNV